MFLLFLFEFVAGLLILLILFTQVGLALLLKRPLFWWFRRTPAKDVDTLIGKLAAAEDEEEASRLRQALDDARQARHEAELRRLQAELDARSQESPKSPKNPKAKKKKE
jgi:hypothetical protein